MSGVVHADNVYRRYFDGTVHQQQEDKTPQTVENIVYGSDCGAAVRYIAACS